MWSGQRRDYNEESMQELNFAASESVVGLKLPEEMGGRRSRGAT